MPSLAIRVLLFLVMVLTLASCGQSNDTQSPVMLTQSDADSNVALRQGQILTVSLHGNGSTGFAWDVEPGAEAILAQQGDSQFVPDSSAVGSGGVYTFTFKAIALGSAPLNLVYHQTSPWVQNILPPPSQVFEVTIVVGS